MTLEDSYDYTTLRHPSTVKRRRYNCRHGSVKTDERFQRQRMSTEEGVMRNTARHPTTNNILYVTAVLPTTAAKDMLLCLMTNVTLA